MKVLFDNSVPAPLARFLIGHEVRTARSMRWHELENSDLLKAAEQAAFELLVTADQNLSYQQNLSNRKLALVVLSTKDWSVTRQSPELITHAVNAATPKSYQEVTFTPRPYHPF